MEFNQIIKSLELSLSECVELNRQLRVSLEENAKLKKLLEDQLVLCKETLREVDEREVAVLKIENVVKLRDDTQNARLLLEEEIAEFNDRKAAYLQEEDTSRKEYEQLLEGLRADRKALAEGRAALEEAKKNYKTEVLKELQGKVEGK